jgi:hypothetical protein
MQPSERPSTKRYAISSVNTVRQVSYILYNFFQDFELRYSRIGLAVRTQTAFGFGRKLMRLHATGRRCQKPLEQSDSPYHGGSGALQMLVVRLTRTLDRYEQLGGHRPFAENLAPIFSNRSIANSRLNMLVLARTLQTNCHRRPTPLGDCQCLFGRLGTSHWVSVWLSL